MTFGQTLKQLLNISGVKLAHIADGLGYDASYVSRWANDIKKPSLKNNDDLFERISEEIIKKCSDSGKMRLVSYINCDDSRLFDKMVSILRDAYGDIDVQANCGSEFSPNASIFFGSNQMVNHETFKEAIILEASKLDNCVQCICASKLSINGNVHAGFFSTVLPDRIQDKQYSLMIHQLIDMGDFALNIDRCCAAICTFTRYDDRVKYTFYEASFQSSFEDFIMIGEQMLFSSYKNPLSGKMDTIVSFDSTALKSEYEAYKRKLEFLPKILKFYSSETVQRTSSVQYFYNFVMDGRLKYFLDFMQPIYASVDFFEYVSKKYELEYTTDGFSKSFNDICAKAKKDVVIYRSALLDYIYSGEIFILGKVIKLEPADRIKHLEALINNIECGDCKMTLLDDVNPLLNREDTSISFFLSDNIGFMTALNDEKTPMIRIRSAETVCYFREFFEHFRQLDDKYIISDDESLKFIRRGLDILSNM